MALPTKNRLQKEKDFQEVFRGGKAVKHSFLFLKYLPNGKTVTRFGFSVPAKAAKKAVRRNEIKRALAQEIQGIINKIKTGYDVVVVAGAADGISGPEIRETAGILLRNAGLREG